MKILKTKILLFSLLSCSLGMSAQTKIGYSYDAAGNRVKREIVMKPSFNQAKSQSASYFDMVSDRQVKISPNPTNGHLRVEVLNGNTSLDGEAIVYSSSGAKVAASPISNRVADIDISSSANGIYILSINIGESSTSWKIIKE